MKQAGDTEFTSRLGYSLQILSAAAVALWICASPMRASEIVMDFTGETGLLFQANATFGWSFTVNRPIQVDRLGFFDDFVEGGPGLRNNHRIRIWTDDGLRSELTEVTVSDGSDSAPSTAANGQWKYENIEPLVLRRGEYVIGADDPFCDSATCDRIRFLGTINTMPEITYGRTRNSSSTGFPTATTPGREAGYFGPNFWATPLPGPDLNFDDRVSCLDVDALVSEIADGTNDGSFDMTGDGQVDQSDLSEWLIQAAEVNLPDGDSYIVGDANLDGSVDVSDFNSWNGNKFTATAAWCSGDFNADGSVDVSDFNLWNANKFTSSDSSISAVPEPPSGASLLCLMAILRSMMRTRLRNPSSLKQELGLGLPT